MKETLSPIEQEFHFIDWCKRNGIKQFLFDGDDTLWGTVDIFRKHQDQSYQYLASVTSLPAEEWQIKVKTINDRFFETHGVNPQRWHFVVAELGQQNNLSETIKDNTLAIIMQIYEDPPQLLEGTKEALEFLKKIHLPFGIVTHANEEWTRRKFRWLFLSRFLEWEDIYIIDENSHKTEESWQRAIKYFGCRPEEIAIVGDSPRSDINPSQKLGVKNLFLVEGDIPRWSIHNEKIDSEVHTIRNLAELIVWGINH